MIINALPLVWMNTAVLCKDTFVNILFYLWSCTVYGINEQDYNTIFTVSTFRFEAHGCLKTRILNAVTATCSNRLRKGLEVKSNALCPVATAAATL